MSTALVDEGLGEPSDAGGIKTWLVRGFVIVVVAAVLIAAALMLRNFLGKPDGKKLPVHNIELIKQPPPPPPKPPEKPPEPPKEVVKVDVPKEITKPDDAKQPDEKPPSDKPLALEGAAGTGPGDGFGLEGRIGGKDLLSTGGGGGAYYSGLLQKQFYEALLRNRKMLEKEFKVTVKIWLGDDGKVLRTDLVAGTGDTQLDSQIQTTLAEMPALRDVPPTSLRAVQLRLSNRS